MQQEFTRMALILMAALALGWSFDQPLEVVLIACFFLLIWQTYRLRDLYRWVRNPRSELVPESSGLMFLLYREINHRNFQYNARKRQLTTYLSQFRRAASVIPDGMVLIDEAGKIEWANINAYTLLGVEWPRDKGVRVSDLLRDPDCIKLLDQVYPDPQGIEFSMPGSREQTLNMQCLRYTENLRMVIVRDISRLLKVNKMHTDFIANVSHELKTPLTVLKGYLEIMQGHKDLHDSLRTPVSQMSFQSERMEQIVNELIYLAKLEEQAERHTHLPVNVSQLVNTILESIQPVIESKCHKISLQVDPALSVLGNMSELHSAFSNLLTNAVNYTPASGEIHIGWEIDSADGVGVFTVADNGPGIPAGAIPNLTRRFYRVDDDRSRGNGGTGLGLAIVKHVLNRHNAKLEISSSLDIGSEFRCTFPEFQLANSTLPNSQIEAG